MHSLLFVLAILGQRHAMFGAPPAPAPAPAVEMRAPATDPAQLLKGANQKLLDQQREIGDLQKQVDALKAERDKAQTALIAATARSRIHTDELATARAEIARLKAALAASGNHSIDAPKPAAPERRRIFLAEPYNRYVWATRAADGGWDAEVDGKIVHCFQGPPPVH